MSNKTFKRKNIWFNDNITTTNATPLEIKEDKVYTHRLWYIINIKIIVSICSSNKISLIWSHTSTIYGLIIDPHDWSSNRCNKNMVIIWFSLIFRLEHLRQRKLYQIWLDDFTVVWPLNESEAGVDLIETSLPFLCKFLLIITSSGIVGHFIG